MANDIFAEKHFHDEDEAYKFVEARIWPNGPVCPHCGETSRISKMKGKSTRRGVYKCYGCRSPFSVKVGTVFEASHLPLRVWLQGFALLCASKKGISSNQLHRTLGISIKAAWFMSHRLREAMKPSAAAMFGSGGKIVESDETFLGRLKGQPKRRAFHHKMKVLTLIERDSGQARSVVIDNVKHKTLAPILRKHIAKEAKLMTDEAGGYRVVGQYFAKHGVVRHGREEYVHPDDPTIHTNTAEGYFSIFKRGMKGIYQHCSERHLHRYIAEFDFRYNHRARLKISDTERAEIALRGIVGKRLTYKETPARPAA